MKAPSTLTVYGSWRLRVNAERNPLRRLADASLKTLFDHFLMVVPHRLPSKVVVVAHGHWSAGMAINLRFHMEKKNDYNFIVFLDQTGRAEVGKAMVLRWARADADAFPMDYVDLAAGYAGRITVALLGSEDLDRALVAYAIYRNLLEYPARYLAALLRAHRFAVSRDACSIFVQPAPDTMPGSH